MEIRNIVTFLKVASTQNFSKAAKQLGYSQSAVTVQIQQLEKELSTQLFERIGKRVYLTEKGQDFNKSPFLPSKILSNISKRLKASAVLPAKPLRILPP